MENREIYDLVRTVPDKAKKPITDGRMKGKSDISPMWRIEKLTEVFGPCGIGWWYVIKDQRTVPGADGTAKAFVDIDLFYRWKDQVSQPIPGIGGNTYIAKERNGLFTDDDAFKKALSDAIGTAAKAIGVAADVYMGGEDTKYTRNRNDDGQPPRQQNNPPAPMQPERYDRPRPIEAPDGYYHCSKCDEIIKTERGKSSREWAGLSLNEFGTQLCASCGTAEYKRRTQQSA